MFSQLFSRFPPKVATAVFYLFLVIVALYYYLFGTLWGIFVLSLMLWWLAPFLFGVEPLTAAELVNVISDLPGDYRIAVLSSVLTIVGFLIAFQLATLNWKQQMNSQLKYTVATEIEQFFSEADSLVTKAKLFAESVIDAIKTIGTQPVTGDSEFKIRYLLGESKEFFAVRTRLSEQSIEVHRIVGKHYSLLSTMWGGITNIQRAVDAFSEITTTMWFFVPVVSQEDPDFVIRFVSQVNVDEYQRFIECCDERQDRINGLVGALRGQLLSQIVGFNLSGIAHLLSLRGKLTEAVTAVYRKPRQGG